MGAYLVKNSPDSCAFRGIKILEYMAKSNIWRNIYLLEFQFYTF